MSSKKPSRIDRVRVATWSKDKCLKELEAHALAGDDEWVELLLEKTDYERLPKLLSPKWWIDTGSRGDAVDRVKRGSGVVRRLLKRIPPDRLPPGKDADGYAASFDHALLKLLPKPKPPRNTQVRKSGR